MPSTQLKISVVTVSYNAAATIEKTMLSVLNQTYDNIEYILIDGGSTDNTVDIIGRYIKDPRYAKRIAHYVSEPDEGIYDAMNKGIAAATGDYISFMNAGDSFTDKYILQSVVKEIANDVILAVCNWNDVKRSGNIRRKPLPIKHLHRNILCSHQAMLINLEYHKKHIYDTSLKFCADYKFVYNAYFNDSVTIQYINNCLSNYVQDEGYSANNIYKLEREKLKIWQGNKFKNRMIIEYINLRRLFWKYLTIIIPENLSNKYIQYRLSRK